MNTSILLERLINAGITQAEIGKRVGLSQSYISELLNRKKGGRISYHSFTKIKRFYDEVANAARKEHGAG